MILMRNAANFGLHGRAAEVYLREGVVHGPFGMSQEMFYGLNGVYGRIDTGTRNTEARKAALIRAVERGSDHVRSQN